MLIINYHINTFLKYLNQSDYCNISIFFFKNNYSLKHSNIQTLYHSNILTFETLKYARPKPNV